MWIIKLFHGYVKSGKLDTKHISEAKRFNSMDAALNFINMLVPSNAWQLIRLDK